MGKIKGWKKVRDKNLWLKETNRDVIDLSVHPIPDKKGNIIYEVILKNSTLKLFKTKKEALDYAIAYMRSHPNG